MLLPLAAAACGAALATGAHASTIFAQDFSNGLSANEQMGGRFQATGGKGGHVDYGYVNNEFSYYDISLDLTHILNASFQFDYTLGAEVRWDGFNVLASTDDTFDWRTDLIAPVGGGSYSGMNVLPHLGDRAVTGFDSGRLAFDLTPFAGRAVKLRVQFESDRSNVSRGLLLDDILVSGTYEPGFEPLPPGGVVPEPATWAMLMTGFFGTGALVRRRRPALA